MTELPHLPLLPVLHPQTQTPIATRLHTHGHTQDGQHKGNSAAKEDCSVQLGRSEKTQCYWEGTTPHGKVTSAATDDCYSLLGRSKRSQSVACSGIVSPTGLLVGSSYLGLMLFADSCWIIVDLAMARARKELLTATGIQINWSDACCQTVLFPTAQDSLAASITVSDSSSTRRGGLQNVGCVGHTGCVCSHHVSWHPCTDVAEAGF